MKTNDSSRSGFPHRLTRLGVRRLGLLMSISCVAMLTIPACRRRPVEGAESPRASQPVTPWFEDVFDASGIDFKHVTGAKGDFWFPEISVGGACLFDYDGDGLLDVYMVQGGTLVPDAPRTMGNKLYRNLGNFVFEDVTGTAGVGDTGYGTGCACGDYDADGDIDLYVTNVGPNVLYRNEGNGMFADVTEESGVGDTAWGASAAFVDYDEDGHLDLFVSNYINWSIEREMVCRSKSGIHTYCSPLNYNTPAPDSLYHNEGNGKFRDVSESSGIRKIFGNGFGVACGDYNRDGHVDLYVANDGMPNQLWLNHGDGTFADESLLWGCAVNMQGKSEAGMGVSTVDIDHDGDLDLFVTHLNLETNTFYLNEGEWFTDATSQLGLVAPSMEFTGFGIGFADFDHDGNLDIYVANGRVSKIENPYDADNIFAEPNQVLSDRGDGRFVEIKPRGGTTPLLLATSRAAAFGDLNNDGAIDIVVANMDGKPHLLRNVIGANRRSIQFRVLERDGTDAINADVALKIGGKTRHRQVQTAYSFGASNDPRVHFGVGEQTEIQRVTVTWSDGKTETFGPFESNTLNTIRRGDDTP